jgi:excisionase family DNA binding protein
MPQAAEHETLESLVRRIVREEIAASATAAQTELLSTAEAAGLAKVAPDTVRRWVREGRIEALEAGRELRFRRADIDKLLRGTHRRGPVERVRTPEEIGAALFTRGRVRP